MFAVNGSWQLLCRLSEVLQKSLKILNHTSLSQTSSQILRYYFNWQYLEAFHSEELLLKPEYSESKDLLNLFRLGDYRLIIFETIPYKLLLKYAWVC